MHASAPHASTATQAPREPGRWPYGRYADAKALGISDWGPKVPAQLAWCLQELPALGAARLSGAAGLGPGFGDERRPAPRLFGALRESGPRLSGGIKAARRRRSTSWPPPLLSFVNGYLQAGALGGPWASAVPGDAAFGGGLLLFLAGALGNAYHDALLRALRPGETGYKVPSGPLRVRVGRELR